MNTVAIDEKPSHTPYHIRPEDIDVSRHFYSAFGKAEVEFAARDIVKFCQQMGSWKAFTKESLEKFYKEVGGKETFPFYELNEKLLVRRPDGKYCVTNLFVERCFIASPKKRDS